LKEEAYIQAWAVILMGWTFFQSLVGHTKIPRNFRTGIARFSNNGFAAILKQMTVTPVATIKINHIAGQKLSHAE